MFLNWNIPISKQNDLEYVTAFFNYDITFEIKFRLDSIEMTISV